MKGINYKKVVLLFMFILGLNCFAQNSILKVDQITIKDGLPQNSVYSIEQDKYGFLWFASFTGLFKYDGYQFTEYIPDPDKPNHLVDRGVYNLVMDEEDNLWVIFFDTTFYCRYNYETDDFTRFHTDSTDNYVKDMSGRWIKDPLVANNFNGLTWIYNDGLLLKVNENHLDTNIFCLNYPRIENKLSGCINRMFLDNLGTLWIGTRNQGLYKVNTFSKPFYSYLNSTKESDIIRDFVRTIYEDNNVLWLGTDDGGVIRYDRKKSKKEYFLPDPTNPDNSLAGDQIRIIYQDSLGYIWFGTKGGLSRYDEKSNTFRNYHPNEIPHEWVHAILEDHEGILWIGTYNGIARYDRKNDKFIQINYEKYLSNHKVGNIIEDREHRFWISTQGGGVICLERTDTLDKFNEKLYFNIPGDKTSLSSNRVFFAVEDENGIIWFATIYGLSRLDPTTGLIKRFTMDDELPNEVIMGILPSGNGYLWISHKKGLTRLNTVDFSMQHYTSDDGLLTNNFSENGYYRNPRTGEMFFGNTDGLNSFYPDSIKNDNKSPKLYFTNLYLLNQKAKIGELIEGENILDKSILFTNEIELTNKHKSFSVEFAALYYLNPKSIKYKYKLEGFDEKWSETRENVRMATYSNLSPGNYKLKVLASNSEGIWATKPAVLSIGILPPWWRTWEAYTIYIIIILGFLYWIYSYIISKEKFKNTLRYEKMKAQKIHELDELKMQFFTNISHELRTPLTLLIDPIRKLKNGQVLKGNMNQYLNVMYKNANHLLKLINQLLDFRKIEAKQLHVQEKEANLITFLQNVAEVFRLEAINKNINFTFKSDIPNLKALFDPDKFEKIIINLLSNAFKYTQEGGKIDFLLNYATMGVKENVKSNSSLIELVVADNGIGIPEKAQNKIFDIFYQVKPSAGIQPRGTGIGLALTKELIDLMHGNIHFESKEGQGTKFIVTLPIVIISDKEVESFQQINTDKSSDNPEYPDLDISEDHETNNKKHTVLIIEDNQDVRMYIKNELVNNYIVLEADNGQIGYEMAVEHVPDIVISDVMMPVLDGVKFCKILKEDMNISHIPVILLTARHSEQFMVEGFDAGADAYITKPFNSNVLMARIKSIIENREKLHQCFGQAPFLDIVKMANNKADENFLNHATEIISNNLNDPRFGLDMLASEFKMNRKNLSHKIKILTGKKAHEFVLTVKLNKAAELLLMEDLTIAEVGYKIGYSSPSNFARGFLKQFGKSPKEYISSFNSN